MDLKKTSVHAAAGHGGHALQQHAGLLHFPHHWPRPCAPPTLTDSGLPDPPGRFMPGHRMACWDTYEVWSICEHPATNRMVLFQGAYKGFRRECPRPRLSSGVQTPLLKRVQTGLRWVSQDPKRTGFLSSAYAEVQFGCIFSGGYIVRCSASRSAKKRVYVRTSFILKSPLPLSLLRRVSKNDQPERQKSPKRKGCSKISGSRFLSKRVVMYIAPPWLSNFCPTQCTPRQFSLL